MCIGVELSIHVQKYTWGEKVKRVPAHACFLGVNVSILMTLHRSVHVLVSQYIGT